jgi:hypothetical protein
MSVSRVAARTPNHDPATSKPPASSSDNQFGPATSTSASALQAPSAAGCHNARVNCGMAAPACAEKTHALISLPDPETQTYIHCEMDSHFVKTRK